jgi:hypothetical protein
MERSAAMRTLFDRLAKRVLERAFRTTSEVRAPLEIAPETQAVDVWIQPATESAAERTSLGLLGRMVDRTSLLEPFHEPPDATQVRDCVLKMLAYDAQERRDARAAQGVRTAAPLWILSAGAPRTALSALGFAPAAGWPGGVYALPPGWTAWLVAISELPETRDTLLLRLLGAGAVLRAALAELAALPQDALEVEIALPVLQELRVAVSTEPMHTDEERQFAMEVQKTYQQIVSEVRAEGRLDGQTQLVLRMFTKRLQRELTATERTALLVHIARLGPERVGDLVIERTPDALLAWLNTPDAS